MTGQLTLALQKNKHESVPETLGILLTSSSGGRVSDAPTRTASGTGAEVFASSFAPFDALNIRDVAMGEFTVRRTEDGLEILFSLGKGLAIRSPGLPREELESGRSESKSCAESGIVTTALLSAAW